MLEMEVDIMYRTFVETESGRTEGYLDYTIEDAQCTAEMMAMVAEHTAEIPNVFGLVDTAKKQRNGDWRLKMDTGASVFIRIRKVE